MAQGGADALAHGIAQADPGAGELRQVVRLAKGERRPAAIAGQGREVEQLLLLVQIQVEQTHAVAEGVGFGGEAPVLHPAAVQGAVHHSTSPKARATRRALTTPSSWKPLAQ
ncbi:hypothetical protein FQZ97_1234300 [compost metagenome]